MKNCKLKVLATDKHRFLVQWSLRGWMNNMKTKLKEKYGRIKKKNQKSSFRTEWLRDKRFLGWLIILSPVD